MNKDCIKLHYLMFNGCIDSRTRIQTDRQTDRDRQRDTCRHMYIQTETDIHIHRTRTFSKQADTQSVNQQTLPDFFIIYFTEIAQTIKQKRNYLEILQFGFSKSFRKVLK